MTAAPMLPGRRDAPTMATDRGRSTCSTAATAAVRSRSSKRRRPSSVRVVGKVTSSSPGRVRTSTGNPESRNVPIILRLLVSTTAVNWRDALGGRRLRELGEQERGDPAALPAICHGERDLRAVAAVRDVLAVSDHLPVVRGHGEEAVPPRVSVNQRAIRPRSAAALKKRNQRASSESSPKKHSIRSTSSGHTGRTWTVEPSRSAMSDSAATIGMASETKRAQQLGDDLR